MQVFWQKISEKPHSKSQFILLPTETVHVFVDEVKQDAVGAHTTLNSEL